MTDAMLIGATLAAILFFGLWRVERTKAGRALDDAALLTNQLDQQRQHMNALTGVLLELDGGVEARVEEHAQLALALQKDSAFLRDRPELAVYLNRNNSLYCELQKILPGRAHDPLIATADK
ncbi:hypothetical protein [Massilia sp. LjRoot122]|uniref:hypothetical protein n=1 Tax=Massilia sp. LjRoot122 TaxID=3342257 RepID=UPI003ECF8081